MKRGNAARVNGVRGGGSWKPHMRDVRAADFTACRAAESNPQLTFIPFGHDLAELPTETVNKTMESTAHWCAATLYPDTPLIRQMLRVKPLPLVVVSASPV